MRLLLAEDERELANALEAILKHHGYSVDVVYNGADAIDYLASENYDGAVLDIMMPKADGLTVLKTVRDGENNIPILLLTALSEIDDRVKGLDLGADDYLTKPFSMKELLARIRAMTRRQSVVTSNILTFGNISLNRTTYELSSPSGVLRLANKEFQMMEMLMTHPDQYISTELFMQRIWGYDSESEINVVWVYISYLRKKLSSLNAELTIKATRNMGYTLSLGK
ncbi:MAG: response regulator transcription factor [Clostridiales bacterium]|nr:response regulator transcription factor [Clostridiales bacterium]